MSIGVEVVISDPEEADAAYLYCLTEFGQQIQNTELVWECKSFIGGARFILYDKDAQLMFALKYG